MEIYSRLWYKLIPYENELALVSICSSLRSNKQIVIIPVSFTQIHMTDKYYEIRKS